MGTSKNQTKKMAFKMNIIRAPFFSRWLCRMKRQHDFTWRQLADYLDVSPQCIDSYSTGRAHPQIMRFYLMMNFFTEKTPHTYEYLLRNAFEAIKLDAQQKYRINNATCNIRILPK